jgi:hypothetical protein
MQITVTFDEITAQYASQLQRLGEGQARVAMQRALSHTGAKAKTAVARALTAQTGLKAAVLKRAVKPRALGALTLALETHGGDVALKYFGARETNKGVSAAPWNARHVFAGSFMKGGLFPNRVALSKGGGHVFMREGKSRLPIIKGKSGLYIPTEMLKGGSVASWRTVLASDLAPRVGHEIARMLPGGGG